MLTTCTHANHSIDNTRHISAFVVVATYSCDDCGAHDAMRAIFHAGDPLDRLGRAYAWHSDTFA